MEPAHTRKRDSLEEKQIPPTKGGISKRERLIKIRLKINHIVVAWKEWNVAWKADMQ